MGKIKSQKQTIKLKVGKHLSKGSNITNTSFKTKKIKIGNRKTFGDSTDLKHLISQILSNLKNENKSSKLHKLKKLHSIICFENDIPVTSLNYAFKNVADLILDKESSEIRRQTVKLMQVILQKLPSTHHCVHFSFLKSLVRSAMTDINVDVRYDSLLIVKLILDWLPELVTNSHSLLNTMLCLISTRSKLAASSSSSSSFSLISPCEKTGTLEWKKKVLKYLTDFLQANIIISERVKVEEVANITAKNQVKKYTLIQYYVPDGNFSEKCSSDNFNEINFNFNLEAFENFINDLLPILYDTWVEYSPSAYHSIIGAASTYVQSEAMLYILQIISYLCEWLNVLTNKKKCKELFDYESGKTLLSKIFSNFPYSEEIIHSSLTLKLNLTVCKIYSQVLTQYSSLYKIVPHFLFEQMRKITGNKTDILAIVLQILEDMLHRDINLSIYEQNLKRLLNLYVELQPDNECRKKIQNFFTKLSIDLMKFHHVHNSVALCSWWMLLPSEFVNLASPTFNEVDEKLFGDLLPLCQRNCKFVEAVSENIQHIIPLIRSSNKTVSSTALRFVALLRPINREHFILITEALRDNNVSLDLIKVFLIKLTKRSQTNNPGFSLVDLLRFIVNLAFGLPLSDDKLPECTIFKDLTDYVPFDLSNYTIVPDSTKSHKDIANFAIGQLCLIRDQEQVHSFIEQYMHILLQNLHTMSIDSAIVALKFASQFLYSPSNMFSGDILLQLSDLTLACFLYTIAAKTACEEDKELDIDWQNILKVLRQYTCDVGSVFRVILSRSSILYNPKYVFCVGQLLIQLISAMNFRPDDISDLCAVLKILKTKYGRKVTQQSWWCKISKFFQQFRS